MYARVFLCFVLSFLCLFGQSVTADSTGAVSERSDTLLHLSTADSAALVEVEALIKGGRYADAESEALPLLARVETEHGAESFEAAKVLDQLVVAMWRGGKVAAPETEETAQRAIAIKEKIFGDKHLEVANSLKNLADIYLILMIDDKAEPLYKRALEIREEGLGSDHEDAAKIINNLAALLSGQRRYAEAEPLYRRAISIKEKNLGTEHPSVATTYFSLGIDFMDQDKFAEAEPLLKKALEIREKALGPEHTLVSGSLYHLAKLYWKQGDLIRAESLQVRALNISEKNLGPVHPTIAEHLLWLGFIYDDLGRFAEAEAFMKRSLAMYENVYGPVHQTVSKCLNNLGLFYENLGKYAEAEPYLKRDVEVSKEWFGPESLGYAAALHNLAILYQKQGRYDETERLNQQILEIREKAVGPEHRIMAFSFGNIAYLYLGQGKYEEAESFYKRALAIWEKTLDPNHSNIGDVLISLGDIYTSQKRYSEAEEVYNRALNIYENASDPDSRKPEDIGSVLNGLAVLYSRQGKFAEAEQLFERALSNRKEYLGPGHPSVAWALDSYSIHNRRQGNYESALELARRSIEIRRKHFEENSTVLAENDVISFSRALRWSVNNYLSCFMGLGITDPEAVISVADIILSSKGQVSDGIFERQATLVNETDSTILALAEAHRLTKLFLSKVFVQGSGEDVQSYHEKVDSLTKLAHDQETELARYSTSFRAQQDNKNINSERITNLLPERAALIEYVKYHQMQLNPDTTIQRYLGLVINNNAVPLLVDLGEASEIEPLVEQYRQHLLSIATSNRQPNIVDLEEYRRIGFALYDKLWKPVSGHLSNKELILVAPDGGLNMVSFAGLINDEGKYLNETHAIHYLSSGRDLIRMRDRSHQATGLFALGDPEYNASVAARLSEPVLPEDTVMEPVYYASTRNVRSGCGYLEELTVDRLPGTRTEVEQIAAGWRLSSTEPLGVFLGAEASEEKFKAGAPGYRMIHLATHGYFLEGACQEKLPTVGDEANYTGENPLLLTGLFLAGANLHGEGSETPGAEDGILTAYEVSGMDFKGTELVVLSACETGLGEVKEGEGVYGLRRAFQMAGARTVISALWPVSDKVTAEMMGRMYDRGDETIPERMRRVQLEKINELRARGDADHPFNWGAFIALGDWR